MSASTWPGPTDGSWSTSPTSMTAACGGTARSSACISGTSTIDISSTTSRSHSSGCDSCRLNPPVRRVHLEQAVDRLRLEAGRLRQPLGRAAGRRARAPPATPRAPTTARIAFSSVVLPTPGPPVMTRNFDATARRSASACIARERHRRAAPRPRGWRGRRRSASRARWPAARLRIARRDDPLGRVQAREEHARRGRPPCPRRPSRPRVRARSASRHERFGDVEQLRRAGQQVRERQAAVPVVGRLEQRVADAGARPDHRRLLDAERRRHLVGRQEPDAADVGGQPVRVLGDDGDRVGAVGPEDPHGARGADAVRVQEDHDVAHRPLLAPGVHDPPRRARGRCRRPTAAAPVSWSMTSNTDVPNASTRRRAKCGPIPFTSPEPRYFSIPSTVDGATDSSRRRAELQAVRRGR